MQAVPRKFITVSTHMPLARHDAVGVCFSVPRNLVSTHMPLARHDAVVTPEVRTSAVSTHMPLARHDMIFDTDALGTFVSTHMPLARHDKGILARVSSSMSFYSHASCEA